MAWITFTAAALMGLMMFLNNSADAKVKKYTDEQGTVHITNVEPGEQVQAPGAAKGRVPAPPGVRSRRVFPEPQPEAEPEPPSEDEEPPPVEEEVHPEEQVAPLPEGQERRR